MGLSHLHIGCSRNFIFINFCEKLLVRLGQICPFQAPEVQSMIFMNRKLCMWLSHLHNDCSIKYLFTDL